MEPAAVQICKFNHARKTAAVIIPFFAKHVHASLICAQNKGNWQMGSFMHLATLLQTYKQAKERKKEQIEPLLSFSLIYGPILWLRTAQLASTLAE
jgi:hypothetical protein